VIVLFTDFGLTGPYTGQLKAVLQQRAPGVPVIDLFANAPMQNQKAAAYLLAAYATWFRAGSVFLCVVDPGVGGERLPVMAKADGRWFVGPGNGLFEIIMRRAQAAEAWEIAWQPEHLSASFHGRDLFAPVAAIIASGESVPSRPIEAARFRQRDWPDDLFEIVYVDHYGNAMTGVRASFVPAEARLTVNGTEIPPARTFSDKPVGAAFWYENSNGLLEIAMNRGRADQELGLTIGASVKIA
jgi:S-adenosyl-L-methionine hydrolase (adenosine-forming)